MKPRFFRASLPFASTLASVVIFQSAQAQQYWRIDNVNAAIGSPNWSSSPGGPFTGAFTTNGNIVFGANSSITGATVDIGNITVGNGFTVNFTASGTLGTGGNVRTLDVGAGSTLNLAGQQISTVAGTGLIKNGSGTLVSSNPNSYTGGFTINAGTVALVGTNAMGNGASQVLTINGGTIRSSDTTLRNLNAKYGGGIVIGGDFTLGDTVNNGTLTFTNDVQLGAANRSIAVNSNVTWSGVISGNSGVGLTKTGAGTLTLNGANTYDGTTNINGGILAITGGGLILNSTSNAININNGGTLAMGRSDTWATNVNTNVTNNPITIGAGGILTNSNSSFNRLGALTLNGGTLTSTGGSSSTSGSWALSSTVMVGGSIASTISQSGTDAQINLGAGLVTATIFDVADATGNSATDLTVSALLQNGRGGAAGNTTLTSSLTKSGAGTMLLSGTNAYTGTTTIQAGSLVAGTNAPSGLSGAFGNATSAIVLGNASTGASDAPSLLIGGAFTVGRSITVGTSASSAYNAIIGGSNTSGTSTFSGGITLTNTGSYTTTLQAATGGTVDFTGTWTNAGNKAIAIGSTGNTGTVRLGNNLSTTGGISVNFGTFLLGSSNLLGDTTPVTVAGGILHTGTLLTDTVSTFNMSSGSLNGTGTITATTYALSGGTVTGNLGAGTLNSSGTVALNGNSAATAVNVTAGTLTLGGVDRLDNGATVTVSGGTLAMGSNTDTVSIFNMSSGSITGSGPLTATTYGLSGGTVTGNLGAGTLNSSGTVALNGTSAATAVNVTAGTLTLGSANRLADGATVTVSGGILDIQTFTDTVGTVILTSGSINGSGAGALTGTSYDLRSGSASAILAGSGAALTKTTAGTVTLSGNNTYTGATTVSAGTILINGNSSTAIGAVNVNAGTLGGIGRIGGAVSVANGATLAPGASIESLAAPSLSMASGSIFSYEVANNSLTGADLLALSGSLSLTGVSLDLDAATLAALSGGGWTLYNKLTLISYGGAEITSGFTGYTDNSYHSFGSNLWIIDYNDTTAGNNFLSEAVATRFVTLTYVPEPSTALLAAFGCLALLRRRRN